MHEAKSAALEPLWVRPKQACQLLSVGMTELYEMLGNGTLRSVRIHGKRLISFESLKRLGERPEAEAA